MKITENKQRRLRHYIDAPKRLLRRARDFYVDSLVNFDGRLGSTNIIACPAAHTSCMAKNFGPNKLFDDADEELEQMYRSMCNNMAFDRVGCFRERGRSGYGGIDRSYSVALGKMGTIDEDEQYCQFEENVAVKTDKFLRTRSHAVTRNYGFH